MVRPRRRRRRGGGDAAAAAAAAVVMEEPDDPDLVRMNRKIRRELADMNYHLRLEAAHDAALQVVRDHHAAAATGAATTTTTTTSSRGGRGNSSGEQPQQQRPKSRSTSRYARNNHNNRNRRNQDDNNNTTMTVAAGVAATTTTTTTTAWMCGVCGLVYANERACELHETRHIRDVLVGLGYWQEETAAAEEPAAAAVASGLASSLLSFRTAAGVATIGNSNRTIAFADEVVGEDGYPGLEADLPDPLPRRNRQQQHDDDYLLGELEDQDDDDTDYDPLLVDPTNNNMVVYTDDALVDVVKRAEPFMLSQAEQEAERALMLLARDKDHYDSLAQRAMERTVNPTARYRSEEKGLRGTFQNKLLDAYQLMKESDGQKGIRDQYNPKKIKKYNHKSGTTNNSTDDPVLVVQPRDNKTLYVNVIVKNSVRVVRHELERLARQRWEIGGDQNNAHTTHKKDVTRFERFRVYTQTKAVKLAGMALASDFTVRLFLLFCVFSNVMPFANFVLIRNLLTFALTFLSTDSNWQPQRIAVQLSNDLYRLLIPRLKRRGVTIETEIEYRVGPYFVLAVNIKSIDWRKLIKTTYRDVLKRQARWQDELDTKAAQDNVVVPKATLRQKLLAFPTRLYNISIFDAIAYTMAFLYCYMPWVISLPVCWVAYSCVWGLGSEIRQFILVSVADGIFKYVESKGMEMDIKVCRTERQAAFMVRNELNSYIDVVSWFVLANCRSISSICIILAVGAARHACRR
jgi:hypothetical protein